VGDSEVVRSAHFGDLGVGWRRVLKISWKNVVSDVN
jgi:hypothetical protein